MANVGGAAAISAFMLIPTVVVTGGLWLGLTEMGWEPWFALLGLANLWPVGPLSLVALLTRPAAVVGVLVWAFA